MGRLSKLSVAASAAASSIITRRRCSQLQLQTSKRLLEEQPYQLGQSRIYSQKVSILCLYTQHG